MSFSSSIMSDSVTPWIAACQATLSFTISQSLLKLISFELMMPSNHSNPFLMIFFLKIFKSMKHFKSLHWICYSIASVLCFGFFGHETCGILTPWPDIEPHPSHWKAKILTTGRPGKSPFLTFQKQPRTLCSQEYLSPVACLLGSTWLHLGFSSVCSVSLNPLLFRNSPF